MNCFWKGSSLNGFPCPVPLGTVSRSINLMTAVARRLPAESRLTCEESGKLALRIVVVDARADAAARGRRKAELGGVAHHIARVLAHDGDQRVHRRIAVLGLDDH